MNRNKLGLTGAALCMLMLILDSRTAAQAAADGVEACIRTVIPALFPFFLISGYITGFQGSGKLAGIVSRMFHAPAACGSVLLAGLLGGYPLGAKLTSEAFRNGSISKSQADRLLMFCSQAGPSFLFGIAAAQLGGAASGWMLWGVQLTSAWAVSFLFPLPPEHSPIGRDIRTVKWNDIMRNSLLAIGSVCGWVVAFSVVIRFLQRWILWILPETLQILICGMLELTNGCLMLSSVADPRLRILLAVAMLNFGGACVVMQTASVAQGLDLRRYLLGKITQTVFSVLFTLALWGHFAFLIPLIVAFYIKITDIFGKRGSNLLKVGV